MITHINSSLPIIEVEITYINLLSIGSLEIIKVRVKKMKHLLKLDALEDVLIGILILMIIKGKWDFGDNLMMRKDSIFTKEWYQWWSGWLLNLLEKRYIILDLLSITMWFSWKALRSTKPYPMTQETCFTNIY